MEYGMNKGVGRSVEFRGLTSQYLFLFAAGMLASLLHWNITSRCWP